MHDLDFATIDPGDLATTCGGDGWQDYKNKVSQDWKDTTSRANEAIKYNLVNGNWQPGKFADNAAGTIFNGGKTVWDATGGQLISAVGLLK
jgi:hypothetical protein